MAPRFLVAALTLALAVPTPSVPGATAADGGGVWLVTLDSTNAAPTPAARDLYGDLQKEFDTKIGEVNRFLSDAVPQLNEALRRVGAPTLMTGKPIELPKP